MSIILIILIAIACIVDSYFIKWKLFEENGYSPIASLIPIYDDFCLAKLSHTTILAIIKWLGIGIWYYPLLSVALSGHMDGQGEMWYLLITIIPVWIILVMLSIIQDIFLIKNAPFMERHLNVRICIDNIITNLIIPIVLFFVWLFILVN